MFTEQVSIQSQISIKRCYKEASIEMASNPANPFHQWIIKLDGKSIKTQKRNILAVPSPQLASYIASEFNNQNKNMSLLSMQLFLLASHAVDLDFDASSRDIMEMSFIGNFENDVILKRHQSQDKLLQKESQTFEPLIAQLNRKFNVEISSKDNRNQEFLNQLSKIKLESFIREMNNWQLVSLNSKIENLESCILGLNLQLGSIDITKALALRKSLIEQKNSMNKSFEKSYYESNLKVNLEAAQLFSQSITTQSIMY
ncbi:unnamed protein product (macronuclear) [Paramecium tetraurelia]|uniref:Uncharacterized protein n=1 Tax=Paramecium tetraurelia TaxID=5888 RepID=A0CWS4_PARTE|nr:uncharacterized protein GSPATT00001444001 [Paramecium tetraurelia]CAK75241.1 unnamed protein product [Paramecium tetraurelia]|eukprot:XP_001442638.1 hypothetical protein (macronuclear) [Paramecium tetraurelia strain d4-2]